MTNVIQADDYRGGLFAFPNWDQPLHMYYDETNNVRRLRLSEVGLNASASKIFAIGGIALKPGQSLSGWEGLRQKMGIQPSAEEVKFAHVAPLDYEAALNSSKLSALLDWLIEADVLIHYSVLDVLYWSIADIIDSLVADNRFRVIGIHAELKNELYFAVALDPEVFMTLLHKFGYPDLKRCNVGAFLQAVLGFVGHGMSRDRNFATTMLKQVLDRAAKLSNLDLVFLHGNESGELIKDFSDFFIHCICLFKHASHVLDRETYVEKVLRQMELRDDRRLLDYRFADSKKELGIQVSDVITGLLGRHFSYLQQHSLSEIRQSKARFSERQMENLRGLKTLVDRSDAYSPALLHTMLPLDISYKNDEFLHSQLAPGFIS